MRIYTIKLYRLQLAMPVVCAVLALMLIGCSADANNGNSLPTIRLSAAETVEEDNNWVVTVTADSATTEALTVGYTISGGNT